MDGKPSPGTFTRLVTAVQELSLARRLEEVTTIVRRTARALAASDGASFILRDGELCYYGDEDAIAPLWKGQRFPMTSSISGWVMLNRRPVIIPDIYVDARIPHDAYRPTFVHSLAVVPIRTISPIGAIGVYWSTRYTATADELQLLAALADSTAVALENIQMHMTLERQIDDCSKQTGDQDVRTELERLHRLREIVRMCAWTRRLEWGGEWLSVESYLDRRFGIQVSHGISTEALSALEEELDL
jgi:GAF domain-containing protein